jgi:hypothetical protein
MLAGPPVAKKNTPPSSVSRVALGDSASATAGRRASSRAPRSSSNRPPAMLAAHMGTALAIASGRPRSTSTTKVTIGPPTSGAAPDSAGEIANARHSAIDARTVTGSPRKPNAGTSSVVGSKRANPRASPKPVPSSANARTTWSNTPSSGPTARG